MNVRSGVIIRTDGSIADYYSTGNMRQHLNDLHAAIGGGCDCVDAPGVQVGGRGQRYTMFVDAEGNANRQPLNRLATALWRKTHGRQAGKVYGNVVIMGRTVKQRLTDVGAIILKEDRRDDLQRA